MFEVADTEFVASVAGPVAEVGLHAFGPESSPFGALVCS
jgi:hypothetical protein